MTFALNLKCFNHVTNPRYVYDASQRAMVVLATEAHLQYLRRIKDTVRIDLCKSAHADSRLSSPFVETGFTSE